VNLRLITILVISGLSIFPREVDGEESISIYYSASLNGNLDGCNCDMNPVAGLVKQAAFLRSHEPPNLSLLVDAGDILDELPDEELARHILDVYAELGYNAIAVGDQELSNGLGKLFEYSQRYPLICHNLFVLTENGAVSFSGDPLNFKIGNLRICMFALIDPCLTDDTDREQNTIRIASPVSTAERLLGGCQQLEADLTIVLLHGSLPSAVNLVENVTGIDLLIFAHEGQLLPPQTIGNTVLVSPGNEGNYLGNVTVTVRPDTPDTIGNVENRFVYFSYSDDPDDPAVRERIRTYKAKLRSLLIE